MKVTTRGKYAVTAMVDLASHAQQGPTSLADISHRQNISLSYLEQLFSKLRKKGLVQSVRGPGGGYILCHAPTAISVAAIMRAVEEPIQAACSKKTSHQGCTPSGQCLTHELWVSLGNHIESYLESIHLSGLLDRQHVQVIF
ncbi:Rrf2 family transcriptional regulator [Magnetococcales bacterium HHB-1]